MRELKGYLAWAACLIWCASRMISFSSRLSAFGVAYNQSTGLIALRLRIHASTSSICFVMPAEIH